MMVTMEELKVGQRVLYHPSTTKRPPEPCEIVGKLDAKFHRGDKVDAYFPEHNETRRVRVSSLALPERSCRECGCIDWWACEGGCFWVEDDLCSTCAQERVA